jgi:hypothetical protein
MYQNIVVPVHSECIGISQCERAEALVRAGRLFYQPSGMMRAYLASPEKAHRAAGLPTMSKPTFYMYISKI